MSTPMLRWSTLKAIQEHFAKNAMAIVASGEEVSPQLFVIEVSTESPLMKGAALDPDMVHEFFRSDETKDMLTAYLKEMFNPHSELRKGFIKSTGITPMVIVQISEAWMLKFSEDDAPAPGSPFPKPSASPNRVECLMVALHTNFGSIPTLHEIVDKPTRHAIEGEFPPPEALSNFSGRMALQDGEAPTPTTKH